MDGDILTAWSWVFWLALILIFIVVEVLSLSFVFLMLAVGSLGGLVAGLVGAPWWVQIIVAGALSDVYGPRAIFGLMAVMIGLALVLMSAVRHPAPEMLTTSAEPDTLQPTSHSAR